ncbi:hypothetical protein AF332_17505 [Sporosarcina globispora]|uniref:Uncharacterized protein n=1 Tax=Sporosarcina globispora TaxID=1459 RepID=A0A0M0GF72_SPOGL|nr:hypothetical protein [Sporosarcina globispora]KON88428.1 hypothetical protein AF332_17505 [Sporosarcina globispora]
MQEHSHCRHRFAETEGPAVYQTMDGIEVNITGSMFQKCTTCGHFDFPVDTREAIESSLKENRKNPNEAKQIYINLVETF